MGQNRVPYPCRGTVNYERQQGVPRFAATEYERKTKDYAILIPIINEGERIWKELERAVRHGVPKYADIVICDRGSSDGSTDENEMRGRGVNTFLMKRDGGGSRAPSCVWGSGGRSSAGTKGF